MFLIWATYTTDVNAEVRTSESRPGHPATRCARRFERFLRFFSQLFGGLSHFFYHLQSVPRRAHDARCLHARPVRV